MDERRSLMAAIIANLEEDTPRLALADWLQEHGDEHDQARAEFIRLQVRAATPGTDPDEKRRCDERAAALQAEHAAEWLGPLREWIKYDRGFHRGLLKSWYNTAGTFLKKPCQQAACERFPLLGVRVLSLFENTKRPKLVADSEALAWAAEFVWLDARLPDDGFEALAASPHTSRLSRFVIDKPRCSDAGLKAFARSRGYPNLRAFGLTAGLWGGKYTAAGLRAVLDSDRFPRLEELDLSEAQRSSVTGSAFFATESLARLRVLHIDMTHQRASDLVASPHLTALEELVVTDAKMTDADAHAMADNPAFARVKVIRFTDLNANREPLGPAAEQALRDRFGPGLTLNYSILCRRG